MTKPTVVNINLSTSGSRLGGAAIAAEFHSRCMAKILPTELWRMWSCDQEFFIDDLKVKNFSTFSTLPLSKFLPRKLQSLFLGSSIPQELERKQPSIIHLHNPLPSSAFEYIVKLANRCQIKVVATTHGFFEVMNPNYNFQFYEKIAWQHLIAKPIARSISQLDGVFSLYPQEREMLLRCGLPEEKIFLAPNGVNPFFLQEPTQVEINYTIQKFELSLEKPILLFIGNHTPNKGLPTVMEVAAQISQPCTIVVGGKLLSPDEPKQWQQKFPTNRLANVIFTDYLTLEEQRALYHLSSALLFPSLADTLPLTIIEAMASSLPVVAYDVGGISYQLDDDCGIVVDSKNFDHYLAKIEILLADRAYQQRLAGNAKHKQKSVFSWEKTAASTADIYHQLLAS